MKPPRLLLTLVLLGAVTTGCVGVRPWERETLSRSDMNWDEDRHEATIRNHVYWSKEASLPGGGAGGGGCGCN
jgi:hypothetical protein